MTPIKKKVIIWLAGSILVLLVLAGIRFFSGEDDWICTENGWMKHGHPSQLMPEFGCESYEAIE